MLFRLFKLIIWIIVIISFVFYFQYKKISNYEFKTDTTIVVQSWDGFIEMTTRELSVNENFLKLYLKNNPLPDRFLLKAWEYNIETWTNIEEMISLIDYRPIQDRLNSEQERLTIFEWWNIFDIDEHLTNRWLINSWDFIKEARNIEKYKENYPFLKEALSLEWFLYPDTYFIIPSMFSTEGITKILLNTFNSRVYIPLLKDKTSTEIVEIVNMASIVEREAFAKWWLQEKATIAWILLKRYKERWFIWADITVCYPYELTSNECRLVVSKYINERNDYNTRTKLWLPKTPINNPHVSSIESVINPIDTPYYYYLHDRNWNIHYARTNEEHNRNRYLYLR